MNSIVHLCIPEKFIPPFINLIRDNFDVKNHLFLIGKRATWSNNNSKNIINNAGIIRKIINLVYIYKCEKILLHGLYDSHILYLLWLQPWLLKKCYWLIWGDDLYQHLTPPKTIRRKIKEKIRASVIRRFGHIVTYIKGDYELAKKWYGAAGKYHDCLLYESNTYREPFSNHYKQNNDNKTRIIIGNSAYPRNNHLEALNRIEKYANEDTIIYAPLSYGPRSEAKKISEYGARLFGDRFIPLIDFMPIDDYLKILNNIDIGVFNQDRQQAMGNMISLLGMGKTIYIKTGTSPWELFFSIGLTVKNIDSFDMSKLDDITKLRNIELVKYHFSKKTLVEQYKKIFSAK